MSSDYISITRPDDWHLHLRDANWLTTTVPHSAKAFGRVIVMPNLVHCLLYTSDAADE